LSLAVNPLDWDDPRIVDSVVRSNLMQSTGSGSV